MLCKSSLIEDSTMMLMHNSCRCGAEMCYGCGKKSHRCMCSGDDMDESEEEMGHALFD